jgi:hypothetical protein
MTVWVPVRGELSYPRLTTAGLLARSIRGYISTAAKHGAEVLTAIRDALFGRHWMPPIPGPP